MNQFTNYVELQAEKAENLSFCRGIKLLHISPSCFYNAVSRLRKRACQIPDPIGKASTLDLTSHKQDVVQIAIEPELSPAELFQDERSSSMYLDNSHTIEIEAKGLTIRMSNTVQPMLLKILMDALKEPLC